MADISRVSLYGKLDGLAYKSLEGATVFCKLRGNRYVELVHWIHQILQQPDSDVHRIARHFSLDASRVARDLLESLDRLPRGATSLSDFSGHIDEAVERGWVYASLKYGAARVRTGHVLVGLLKTTGLRNVLGGISPELAKLPPDDLGERFTAVTAGSPEEPSAAAEPEKSASDSPAPAAMGKQEALSKYAVDLTERAKRGEIDPVVGRDAEIRQLVHVLMRRRQNNPILTGEAGVGKTAVVEGLALRIASGDVPPPLKDVAIRSLDLGLLQAGASMKGEFENRLRMVIEEVQASPKPIILFIDEAHTLIGAGGAAGTGDAANLLKPALARGTLRTIAATTWAEYKKHIEKDPALTRRFQVVAVDEPEDDAAVRMMRGVADAMRKHHRVDVLDEAVVAAVTLARRYIADRQLPDKSVSLLDTACARVAISLSAVPPAVEDARRAIEALELELGVLANEEAVGIDIGERRAATTSALDEERARLAELDARWKKESALAERVRAARDARKQAAKDPNAPAAPPADAPDLAALEKELHELQG